MSILRGMPCISVPGLGVVIRRASSLMSSLRLVLMKYLDKECMLILRSGIREYRTALQGRAEAATLPLLR